MYDKSALLKNIEASVASCKNCRLYQTATNPVPGEGNPNAELVFVGEAPGETEDRTGQPFVGRAGQLLEKALQKIGYKREDVWIGNIIKHRPPQNRDPLPDEIHVCEKYLAEQLSILNPLLIVTLGRFSMNYFYADGKISRDRGQKIKVGKFNVYPVYHPAAALRNPTMMKGFVQDFVRIPKVLEAIKSGKDTVENVTENKKLNIYEADNNQQNGLGL